MRIGELATAAGVTIETLRYYERRGLLAEPGRTPTGYRRYPPSTVDTVRFIKRAQRLGFTLAEITELRALTTAGPGTCDTASSLATTKITDLDQRIADLTVLRTTLHALVAPCADHSDPGCPFLDELAN